MKLHHHIISSAFVASFVIILMMAFVPSYKPANADETSVPLPPSAALSVMAYTTDTGVHLSWLAAHQGSFPIAHYLIFRVNADTNADEAIATLENTATSYDDPDGHEGSVYHLQVVDDQDPPYQSSSDDITATVPPPKTPTVASDTAVSQPASDSNKPAADDVKVSSVSNAPAPGAAEIPPAPTVPVALTSPTASPTLSTSLQSDDHHLETLAPAQQVAQGNVLTNTYLTQIVESTKTNTEQDTAALLNHYKSTRLVILDSLATLDTKTKSDAQSSCSNQESTLETIITTLPESQQMKAIESLAICHLIGSQ